MIFLSSNLITSVSAGDKCSPFVGRQVKLRVTLKVGQNNALYDSGYGLVVEGVVVLRRRRKALLLIQRRALLFGETLALG